MKVCTFGLMTTCFAMSIDAFAKKNDLPPLADLPEFENASMVGPFVLLEWNAADVLAKRMRLRGEYIAMDGVSFGFSADYQNKETEKKWKQTIAGIGASVSQQFQSLSLRKAFWRGEASVFWAQFGYRGDNLMPGELREGNSVGMAFEVVGGYRWVLWQHLTLAPALGVRRLVPDFFLNEPTDEARTFAEHEPVWQPRVEFSIGIGF